MKRILLFLLLLPLLVSCNQRRGLVTVRIIATSDVHGRFFATDFLDGSGRNGSLEQFSSFLKKERRENANVIYVDCGDILEGSVEAYHDVTCQFVKPSLASLVYNYLDCDAAAFGNHDMGLGANTYERFFRPAAFPVLGGNVYFSNYGDYLLPYRIVERHGVKIALIGLTSELVNWTVPVDIRGDLQARDIIESASYLVDMLEDKADAIVAVVHSGLEDGRVELAENRVAQLAAKVPGIDLILYGHDHKSRCSRMAVEQGDSVLVMNPGPYARKAAVATLSFDFRASDNPKAAVTGSLHDISGCPPDRNFRKALSERYAEVEHYADSVIGSAACNFESGCALWRPASALEYLHSIHMGFFGAQVSLAAPVASNAVIAADTFRIRDAFRFYPYDNTMVAVMMRGDEIRRVLERSASLFYNTVGDGTEHMLRMKEGPDGSMVPEFSPTRFVTACGIRYTIDVTKPDGQKVNIECMSDGAPFSGDRLYRTTVSSFLYSGTESLLYDSTGISRKDMVSRLCSTSMSDLRYYLITAFALHHEEGRSVPVKKCSDWKLVPEETVAGFLAADTVNFKFVD